VDAAAWDERYAGADLVWSAEPNAVVAEVAGGLPPGRALDVAAGEGRNAIWLARRGWRVLATDFSPVAVRRMRELARAALGADAARLTCVVADATLPPPPLQDPADGAGGSGGAGADAAGRHGPTGTAYDLVVFCFLHLPAPAWRAALAAGVAACRPGGLVLVVLHARRNLAEGHGGPQDPDVLHDPDDVVASAAELPVDVELAELRRRAVDTPDDTRHALDTVVLLRRRP
jgi:SAM-dependent methyltransferase